MILVIVPTAAITFVCMLTSVYIARLEVALTWFRAGLTVAAIGGCVAVVVLVLDKHRWARDAAAQAVAEAVQARVRIAEARVDLEYELERVQADAHRRIDQLMRELAEAAAFRTVVGDWPVETLPAQPRHLGIVRD